MSAVATRAWPAHGPDGRTHQKVRADSYPEDAAQGYYRPLDGVREAKDIINAARRWTAALRRRGDKWGPLGPVALEVLDCVLFKAMNWKTGQLDWSYDQIAEAVQRSRDAIWRALAQLKAHGFIDWIRRFRRDVDEHGDPMVVQITNAYRVIVPTKVRQWLSERFKSNLRVPDDFAAAKALKVAELHAHLSAEFDDSPMGRDLGRIAALLTEGKPVKR